MNKPKSALILSPNLGCPEIVNFDDLHKGQGFRVIVATLDSEQFDKKLALAACPSYENEGEDFSLNLDAASACRLDDEALSAAFNELGETRRLISTTVRTQVFPGHFFWEVMAKPATELGTKTLRAVGGGARSTLYDLRLSAAGKVIGRVRHALFVRVGSDTVNFVHLTDLHVAARNDLWESQIASVIDTSAGDHFQNFNQHLRDFIKRANEAADLGELDFVLALGDLVDFSRTGLFDRTPGDANWSTVVDILIGSELERTTRNNRGLRVPVFTTTGNHDWRTFPYAADRLRGILGISKQSARELDLWYRNTSVEVGQKLEEMHDRLIRKGSPLLARSWWGAVTSMGLRGFSVGLTRLGQRLWATGVKYWRHALWGFIAAWLGGTSIKGLVSMKPQELAELRYWLANAWNSIPSQTWETLLALLLLALLASSLLPALLYQGLRGMLEGLLAIEADVANLDQYFVRFNPYFNYAFRVDNCFFAILDTGPDCLTAQSFWDNGGRKVERLRINDNILGGSPESMGFFPANEYYPYSQISWLENVLQCIQKQAHQQAGEPRKCRIFVGLHAPPANLSVGKRRDADSAIATQALQESSEGLLLRKKLWFGYNIGYGGVNHYLSEFFYLCLGYLERDRRKPSGPGVDAVFAGHAHWTLEFRLKKPDGPDGQWKPEVYYGSFAQQVEENQHPAAWWGPLLLQTAACGPASPTDANPPNYRYVIVGRDCRVSKLTSRTLGPSAPGTTSTFL
jgi:hypothetical protein